MSVSFKIFPHSCYFSECLHVTTRTTSQLAWMAMMPCPNPPDPHSTWHACVSALLHAAWTPQLGMIANSFSQFQCRNFWASKQSLIFAWKSDHEKFELVTILGRRQVFRPERYPDWTQAPGSEQRVWGPHQQWHIRDWVGRRHRVGGPWWRTSRYEKLLP